MGQLWKNCYCEDTWWKTTLFNHRHTRNLWKQPDTTRAKGQDLLRQSQFRASMRGFVALLERIHAGGIEEVDQLCRFGSELVEWIFEKNGTQLVVLGTDVSAESNEAEELAEDLLAIITVFVAWHNGLRSAANRRRKRNVAQEIKDIQEGSEETFSRQGTTDSHLSQSAGGI
ncbi:IS607 family transposase [Rhizophagus clarus]|uniref:IS607 family transposase n=1 Tax=Rhizophagus clarus TaxID=94130 RepID=A0A8H3KW52_9GLOM|nr:IS607 family transposase [Rhizophagus clarus]